MELLKNLPSISGLMDEIKDYKENNSDDLSVVYNKGKIIDCEEIPIKHSFADQIYLRQMDMSKHQLVIGAIHNHKHIWFLMTGKVSIRTNNEIITHIKRLNRLSSILLLRLIISQFIKILHLVIIQFQNL